jgi:DNA-3-methyladenine glycosylase II
MEPKFWAQACRELSRQDPMMKKLISAYKGEKLKSRGQAFETLLRSIVGQQISVKAAQSIWKRVSDLTDVQSPEDVLSQTGEDLRACGLSGRKVEYAKDLAKHFTSGDVNPKRWRTASDEEVIEELIAVRGIGRWTAEMFLIFHLLRPNVFPVADLGLQKALSKAYKKKLPLGPRQWATFRKQFEPWCSVATWYLWRSLDPISSDY